MLEILGFVAAVGIGFVLGLLGGGGSILAIPVLVYLLEIDPLTATAYSLFVVGVAALVGFIRGWRAGMVEIRIGLVFAAPALVAVYLTRRFMMPAIPEEIFSTSEYTLSRDVGIMILFAVIMLAAAISMISSKKRVDLEKEDRSFNYPLILLEGGVVGVLTGIVGAGGGFLIIPALVLFSDIPIKKAVATSLMIIAIKSLIGFMGDVQNISIDWGLLLTFTGLAGLGVFLGAYTSRFIESNRLKSAFGWFVLVMGCYILIREVAVSV